ncbi:hypothetical protein BH09MYX1_BH09MYX1_37840 [soil metagenome]
MTSATAVKRIRVECAGVARFLKIRELCGEDEETVADVDSQTAIDLLDRLLVAGRGADVEPGHAAELTISERDFALASVLVATFGAQVRETVRCGQCAAKFDFEFDLNDLVRRRRDAATSLGPNGLGFRLPTGMDELAVAGLDEVEAERALLARCGVAADADAAAIVETMESAAPLLDAELLATCPECAASNTVAFDVQSHLLGAIIREHTARAHEIHRLTIGYGWSLTEILRLSRTRRRAFNLLASERDAS